jgi:tyrosine-protein phosphatase SIW14
VISAGLAILLIASGLTVKYGRHYFLATNFGVVEAGHLYRSGYCEPRPLRRIIREYRVRTILTLLSDEPDTRAQQKEEAVVREEGVRVIRIPMPGDGRGTFEQLDRASDLMADAANEPMLVHCHAGANRTGAAFVAYRIRYCGWSFEKAMSEAEAYGYSTRSTPALREHLRRYCDSRVPSKK